MKKLNLLLLPFVLLFGCGDSNQLWGSIRESHSLEFDRLEVHRQGDAVRIEYLRGASDDNEWVCKLIVDGEGLDLSATSQINAGVFNKHVVVERTMRESDTLPRRIGGLLYFDQYGTNPGSTVEGYFNVLFDNGRTLSGSFGSTLQMADVGELTEPDAEELPLEEAPGAGTDEILGNYDDDDLQAAGCACSQLGSQDVSLLFGLPLMVLLRWALARRRRRQGGSRSR